MNRNYKVIWNEALQCFTAVAENAKAKGKSSKSSVSASVVKTDMGTQSGHSLRLSALRSGLIAVGLTSLAIGMSSQAIAAVGVNGGTGSGTAVSECTNDNQANSGTNAENIAIGCASFTNDIGYQIADRDNPYYTNNTTSANTVEEGESQAYTPERMNAGSMAIGTGARTEGVLGLAIGQYARTTGVAGVAIGVGSLSEGNTALAIGRQSVARGDYSQAMGNVAAAIGQGSLAVGHSATATGNRSIAIGASNIDEAESVAGQPGAAYQTVDQTRASGQDSIALGSGAQATTDGSVAIGNGSNTSAAADNVTSATVGSVTFGNFAGAANVVAGDQVSVGASGQERQIKNVAAGNVTATSTDAINGSQLFSVADTLNTNITDNRNNISGNTTNITNNTNRINDGINFGNGVTANNFALGDTINVTGDENITSVTTANGVQVQLNRDIDLDSVTTGNTLVNNDGVTLTGGSNQTIRLSNNGLNNGGNRITNVARATEGSDAVNLNQLDEVRNSATSANQGFNVSAQGDNASTVRPGDSIDFNNNDGNITVSKDANSNDVSFDLNQDLNLDSATFGDVVISSNGLNNGGNRIVNVAAGNIATGSTDAVNGGQLNDTADSIATVIGGNAVNNGGIVTSTNIGGTGENTIDGAISSINNAATVAKSTVTQGDNIVVTSTTNVDGSTNYEVATADDLNVTSVNTGNSTLNNSGLAINDGTGNTTTVTTSGTTVTNAAGNSTSYGADGFTASDNAGNSTIVNQTGVSFTNSEGVTGPSITANGIDAGGSVITNVASGGNVATNAANIGDIQAAAASSRTEVAAGSNVTDVVRTTGGNGQDIYTVNADGASVSGSSAVTVTAAAKNADNVTDYAVDLSQASKDSLDRADTAVQTIVTQIDGTNVKTVNQANNTANFVTGNNIVLSNDSGGIRVSTAENLEVTSIRAGNTTINSNGIDNGGNRITNIAEGVDPTDAVSVSQLDTIDREINGELVTIDRNVDSLGYRIDDVEDDANAGISAAMAMSSLPQAYIAGKSMVGGGIASYNGESAVAIGVSRVSDNGRWVMKINGTADTQGNAGGAIGAGFHF